MSTTGHSAREDAKADAWKVHDAQVQWTSQVDSKASFVLAIETAVMAGIVTLSGNGHRLADLDGGFARFAFASGVGFVIAALACVTWVVRPRLRRDQPQNEDEDGGKHDFIYFGHARRWDPDELTVALISEDKLPVIARQIVRMAEIAWKKHRVLQWSITLAVAGTSLVGVAAVVNG